MSASTVRWWLLPWVTPFLLAGCGNESGPAAPPAEEEIPPNIVLVTGSVTTPSGNRVEFVNVRLYGVYGDSLTPSFELLATDTTDATGAFEVEYGDCHQYPRFFLDLEIACFPIGLREVGCGAWVFDFIWNRPSLGPVPLPTPQCTDP